MPIRMVQPVRPRSQRPHIAHDEQGEAIDEYQEKEPAKAFFSKGGGGKDENPEPHITFGNFSKDDDQGEEESKSEEDYDEEDSPKELEIASRNLRLREQ